MTPEELWEQGKPLDAKAPQNAKAGSVEDLWDQGKSLAPSEEIEAPRPTVAQPGATQGKLSREDQRIADREAFNAQVAATLPYQAAISSQPAGYTFPLNLYPTPTAEDERLYDTGEYKGKGVLASIATSLFDPGSLLDPMNVVASVGAASKVGKGAADIAKGTVAGIGGGYTPVAGFGYGVLKGLNAPTGSVLPPKATPVVAPVNPREYVPGTLGESTTPASKVIARPSPGYTDADVEEFLKNGTLNTPPKVQPPTQIPFARETFPRNPSLIEPSEVNLANVELPKAPISRLQFAQQPDLFTPMGDTQLTMDVPNARASRLFMVGDKPMSGIVNPLTDELTNILREGNLEHPSLQAQQLAARNAAITARTNEDTQRFNKAIDTATREHRAKLRTEQKAMREATAAFGRAIDEAKALFNESRIVRDRQFYEKQTPGGLLRAPDLTPLNDLDRVQVPPGRFSRAFNGALTSLSKMGNAGNQIARQLEWAMNTHASLWSQNNLSALEALSKVVTEPGAAKRAAMMANSFIQRDGKGFSTTFEKLTGLPESVKQQVFDYMYTHGRIIPTDSRAREIGDIFYKHLLEPASNDPGVRSLTITNPVTGAKIPVGDPHMFLSQIPESKIVWNKIKDAQWNALYQRAGGESLGKSLEQFKRHMMEYSAPKQDLLTRKYSGLETARMLDLEALGGSPYEWAKKLGYMTDPYLISSRFNAAARHRGRMALIKDNIDSLMSYMDPGSDSHSYATQVIKHATGEVDRPSPIMADKHFLQGVNAVTDLLMLSNVFLASLPQVVHPVMKAGLSGGAAGMLNMLRKSSQDRVYKSGALYPNLINSVMATEGPMGQFNQLAYRAFGGNFGDYNMRRFAGAVGDHYISRLEKKLLADPQSAKAAGLIAELGGDVQQVLVNRGVPDDMRLSMIQKFANDTAGMTDARTLPLWAMKATENPWVRMVMKYNQYVGANTTAVRRALFNAPTKAVAISRAARLLAGGALAGTAVQGIKDALASATGDIPEYDKEGTEQAITNLLQGVGMYGPSLLMDSYSRGADKTFSKVITGAPGSLAIRTIRDMGEAIWDTDRWIESGEFPATIARPFASAAGPASLVLRPMVERAVREQRQQRKELKRLERY